MPDKKEHKYKKGDLVRSVWDGDFGIVIKPTDRADPPISHRCYLVHWSDGTRSLYASEGDLATSKEYKKLQELPFQVRKMYKRGDLVQHDIFTDMRGVVVEVVVDPELGTRFRVFWADGHESIETRDICLVGENK